MRKRLLTLVLAGVAIITTACASGGTDQSSAQTPAAGSASAQEETAPPSAGKNGQTFEEVAANRRGVPVFGDNGGAAPPAGVPGSIPFGTSVQVSCYAANVSGMTSINAFYWIVGGKWNGLYAPANTFANGDPLGSNGQTQIDPKVPACA